MGFPVLDLLTLFPLFSIIARTNPKKETTVRSRMVSWKPWRVASASLGAERAKEEGIVSELDA